MTNKIKTIKNKKGISVMIGYVLLIVFALAMAGVVYSFLKFYAPTKEIECPQDLSLAIDALECSGTDLTIELENRGLFNIGGAIIKIGEKDSVYRETICFDKGDFKVGDELCFAFSSYEDGSINNLKPRESESFTLDTKASTGDKIVEVTPIWYTQDNKQVLCVPALITQEVRCSTGSIGLH